MPGFVLEEAFPLARFHNTIGEKDGQHFIVGLDALDDVSEDADAVAITVQGEGFKIYNTTDQKCIKSWTTPPGIAFVGPATHVVGGSDAVDYTYAIVASGPDVSPSEQSKSIWLWKNTKNGDNEELDKTTKTYDEPISAIRVSPSLPAHVILISQYGSVELATKDLDRSIAKQKSTTKHRVIWSTVFVTSNAHCCIPSSMVPAMSTMVVTVQQVNSTDYTLQLKHVNVERRSIDLITSIDIKLNQPPTCFTLDPSDGRFTILGSQGTWTVYRMQLRHSSSKKVTGSLTEHVSIQLHGYRFQDDVFGNIASVKPLSDSYVAMVAPRIKKNEVEHVVSVWDVKYGTLQAEQIIKLSEKTKSACTYDIAVLPNSHLAVTVSSVLKSTSKHVKSAKKVVDTSSVIMLCPYYSEPVSLMAAMGKMKPTLEAMGISSDLDTEANLGYARSGKETVSRDLGFNPDEDAEEVYDRWVSRLEKHQKHESATLAKLMAPNITAEEFSSIFFDYVHVTLDTDTALMTEGVTEQYQHAMTHRFNSKKKPVELSQLFVSHVINKCFCQADFWPVDVILYLMSRSLLRSNYAEKGIIRSLLERSEWALLPLVLEKVQDIPESDLVTLIKALVGLVQSEAWTEERFSQYLKMVVSAPRNDIFLQQSLGRIHANELKIIFETIQEWLKDQSSQNYNRSHMVDFANSLLDVHFPTIILEPTLQQIAENLRELVASEIEVVDDLEQLRNILGAYDRKNKHTTAKRIERQATAKNNADAPMDELTKFRKKNKGKFGGEQGIPVYRVEVFRF